MKRERSHLQSDYKYVVNEKTAKEIRNALGLYFD